MLIRRPPDIRTSEITPYDAYLDRRGFLSRVGHMAAGAALLPMAGAASSPGGRRRGQEAPQQVADPWGQQALRGELTPYDDVTQYNNFYEFGTGKADPSRNAHTLVTRPWTVAVGGECAKPRVFDIDEIMRLFPAEERVYRMRCVEAWSMVIPWRGFELGKLLDLVEPTDAARFVAFQTLHDTDQMPGQTRSVLEWPYREGLRMDEARHPLAILATGVYGEDLPNQNGAPLRLVVPWKYGFKGIKSIVAIRLVEEMPQNTWAVTTPNEYGFYANVNPEVDHPRWSQARERRIGEIRMRPTLMFNGYADQVADLYAGMDLRRWY